MSEPRAKQDKVHWINSETATVATMNGIHPPPVLPDDELRNVNMRSDRRPPMSPRYSNTAGGSDPNERGQETPTVGTMRNSKNQFTPQLLDELKRNKRFPAESITLLSGSSAMYNATSDLTESRARNHRSILLCNEDSKVLPNGHRQNSCDRSRVVTLRLRIVAK
ncbi:Uncharacterised protein g2896 [Pycnogonum litorale]